MIRLAEEPAPGASPAVVVDTSVLVDFALETAERHADALLLFRVFNERGVRIRVPFHAAFEFYSAMRAGVLRRGERQAAHLDLPDPAHDVVLHAVPINSVFLDRYVTADLPHPKAGDLLFLALARMDGVPIITEDQRLYDIAREFGVTAWKIEEYLVREPDNPG